MTPRMLARFHGARNPTSGPLLSTGSEKLLIAEVAESE